jgi:hypothetical protein
VLAVVDLGPLPRLVDVDPIGANTWWLWRHGRGIRDPSGTAEREERG